MKIRTALLILLLLGSAAFAGTISAAEQGDEHHEEGATAEMLFKWINFLLVFGAGGYFAAKPLKRAFAGMRQDIRQEIASARQQREAAQKRLREMEQRWAGLQREIKTLREQATANAEAEKKRLREASHREAERLQTTARAEIESATRAARLELRAYAARLAVTLAEENIRRQLTPQAQVTIFEASLTHFPARSGERRA